MKFLVTEPSDFKKPTSHAAFAPDPTPIKTSETASVTSEKNEIHKDPARIPKPPKTVAETGIELLFLRDLLLKTIFRTNIELPSRLTKVMCLLPTVLQEIIELSREQKYIETVGKTIGAETNELRYQLTEAGRARAVDAFTQSEYYGAVPVPLEDFITQAEKQRG